MFEALRRFGYPPEDIFVSWDDKAKRPVTILRREGKDFVIDYPDSKEHPSTKELYETEWLSESNRWNDGGNMTMKERDTIYRYSVKEEVLFSLVLSLRSAGFYIPKLDQ